MGLKYSVNHVVNKGLLLSRLLPTFKPTLKPGTAISYYPGYVLPFIEYKQSRLSIIFKGHRIHRMVNEY